MTALSIYADDQTNPLKTTLDFIEIQAQLKVLGVQFERWEANFNFASDSDAKTVLDAYQNSISELKQQYGFQSVDVISVKPDHPEKEVLRQKFLAEHIHRDFEVRFFVEGQGLFYLHAGKCVYIVLCEKGDLISVPANTPHWFDMGEYPNFKCIRLFTIADGWVAEFTGDTISENYPRLEQFRSAL